MTGAEKNHGVLRDKKGRFAPGHIPLTETDKITGKFIPSFTPRKTMDENHGAENIKKLELNMDISEIRVHVDQIIHNKNLGEKIALQQSSVIELQCMQCGSLPFKLDESVCDETGIICPFCGCFHGITICQCDEKKGQILQEKQSKAVPGEKEEQPIILFQCMKCGNMPFSVDEVISDKTGITCPHCKHVHSITVDRKGSDDHVLFRCMECARSFGVNDIQTDRWAIYCPHCRVLHKIRLILNEKKGGKNEFKKCLGSYQK